MRAFCCACARGGGREDESGVGICDANAREARAQAEARRGVAFAGNWAGSSAAVAFVCALGAGLPLIPAIGPCLFRTRFSPLLVARVLPLHFEPPRFVYFMTNS